MLPSLPLPPSPLKDLQFRSCVTLISIPMESKSEKGENAIEKVTRQSTKQFAVPYAWWLRLKALKRFFTLEARIQGLPSRHGWRCSHGNPALLVVRPSRQPEEAGVELGSMSRSMRSLVLWHVFSLFWCSDVKPFAPWPVRGALRSVSCLFHVLLCARVCPDSAQQPRRVVYEPAVVKRVCQSARL